MGFHGLGALAKQRVVAFAANERKVLAATSLLKDHVREFFFGLAEFAASVNAFHGKHALVDEFGTAGLHRQIDLGKRDFLLTWIAILGNQITGVARKHDVVNFTLPRTLFLLC